MRSRLIVLMTLLLLLGMSFSAYAAQDFNVTPNKLPKNARVNIGGDPNDDQYFWQMVYIKLAAVNDIGQTIKITLPNDVDVADVDGGDDYADEVALSWNTAGATTFTVAATADDITLTVADANTAADDEIWVMFPVTTSASPTGTQEYLVDFSDTDEVDITTGIYTTQLVTFPVDEGNLGIISFETTLSADNDTTSNYGEQWPTSGTILAAALPDVINDEGSTGANQLESDHLKFWDDSGTGVIKCFDAAATNDNDVTYTLWASTQSDLSIIDPSQGGVQYVINFSTDETYTLNETEQGSQAMAVSGLAEGDWYFYITSNVTTRYILAKSDQLHVYHYPWVELVGWDYDKDGTFDEVAPYDDDNSITVDTGSYKRYDGSIDGAKATTKTVEVYIKANDFDDNARVHLFYSTDPNLDETDVTLSGTDVSGLTGATELVPTTALYDDDKDPYLNYTWDLDVDAQGNYLAAGSYSFYVVANDGKHQDVSSAKAHGTTNLTVNLIHSPSLILDSMAEYDSESTMTGVQIDMSVHKTLMISWAKGNAVDGDADIDDDCLISFYLHLDTDGDGTAEFSADEYTLMSGDSNTQQITTGIQEKYESKQFQYYEWDLEEWSESVGWYPTDREIYHLYGVIDENKTSGNSIKRVVALGDDLLLHAGDDISTNGNLQFLNYPYAKLASPPVKGVTVNPDESYRFEFDAFDIDDNGNIALFLVKAGTTFGTEVTPNQLYVGGGTVRTNGILDSGNGEVYMLNSTTGLITNAEYIAENTNSYYDFTLRKPSETTLRYTEDVINSGTDLTAGKYYVYIGVDDNTWKKQVLTLGGALAGTEGDWITASNGASGYITDVSGNIYTVVYNTAEDFVDTDGPLDDVDDGKEYSAMVQEITTASAVTYLNNFSSENIKLYRSPGWIEFVDIAEAAPQKNLMLYPTKLNTSLGDTTQVRIYAADEGSVIDLIDVYIAVEKDFFDIVPGATVASQPFTIGSTLSGSAALISNRIIDDSANNRWILNATISDQGNQLDLTDTDEGTVAATVKIVCKGTDNAIDASSAIYFVNEPSKGWITTYQNDGVKKAYTASNIDVVVQPRGIVEGILEFEGRDTSNYEVTFQLRPHGSYNSIVDATFLTANNDADANAEGLQYTLDTDGKFTLKKVPSGEWDLAVLYDRYLSEVEQVSVYGGLDTLFVNYGTLRGGDCTGYTDSLGYDLPNNRISLADIQKIELAFNATPDSTKWATTDNWKYADINEDGIVQSEDLSMATGHYTGSNVDGDYPVFGKPAVQPAQSNLDALVEFMSVPTELRAGQAYTFQVIVRNAADVKGYYLNFDYDKSALTFDSIVKGDFIDAESYSFPVAGDGTIGIANSVYGPSTFAGDGLLAEVTFISNVDGVFSGDLLKVTEARLVNSRFMGENVVVEEPVEVSIDTPVEFSISQNFPNPFNPTTTINFSIPSNSNVTIQVYDILGRHVKTLVSGKYSAGNYNVMWNARDEFGASVSAGVYFYTIKAGTYHSTKRMLLLK